MLLMVENYIRRESVILFLDMQKLYKIHERSCQKWRPLRYHILGCEIWTSNQKKIWPVDNFEQVKNTSQFNEDFIKNYNYDSNIGYIP